MPQLSLYLTDEQTARLDDLVRKYQVVTGLRVSRSQIAAAALDAFSLSFRPIERTTSDEEDEEPAEVAA